MINYGRETEKIEFKKSSSELKEGIISITSMLNKNSIGTLYFGVKNNGEAVGQLLGEDTLRNISRTIANSIKPQVIPTISTIYINDNRYVIKIEVKGKNIPYSAYGKYYIRSADEDRELAPYQLKELMLKSDNTDEIIAISSPSQNLKFTYIRGLFQDLGFNINEEEFEKNLKLFNQEGNYNLMANLLADKNDISIKVTVFEGKDKTKIIRRNEYGFKCLIIAMEQVLAYIESLNDVKIIMDTIQRQEIPLFNFSCFKEAWQKCLSS